MGNAAVDSETKRSEGQVVPIRPEVDLQSSSSSPHGKREVNWQAWGIAVSVALALIALAWSKFNSVGEENQRLRDEVIKLRFEAEGTKREALRTDFERQVGQLQKQLDDLRKQVVAAEPLGRKVEELQKQVKYLRSHPVNLEPLKKEVEDLRIQIGRTDAARQIEPPADVSMAALDRVENETLRRLRTAGAMARPQVRSQRGLER